MMRAASLSWLGLFAVVACSTSDASKGAPPSDAASDARVTGPESAPPHQEASIPAHPMRDAAAEASLPEAAVEAGLSPYPKLLSRTGLFTDVKTETLGTGVRAFQPKYTLWSDGATKRRWLYLPAGETIDTSDMDYWKYPVGTKVWKEFSLDGKRIETRLLHKAGPKPTDWVMIAYQWNDALTDAEAVPFGVQNANGTTHDIPQQNDCLECHGNMKDRLLGVTAIQLSHDLPGVTITDLISEQRLSHPPAGPFTVPGDAVAEQALGYLHANCGHCHNPASAVSVTVAMDLWESTTALGSVKTTTAYTSTVLQSNSFLPALHIIEPGRPDDSELIYRVSRRGSGQMPPLATEFVDATAVGKLRAWIETMPLVGDGGLTPLDAGARD